MRHAMIKLCCLAAAAVFLAQASAQDLAIRADHLHTGTGVSHAPGVVVITDGTISAVGAADAVEIPDGMEVIEVPVATPGLIDGRSTVGLSGAMNQPHDQDQLESSDAIQPELRAIDAYNPRELLVQWLREHGITTIHTGHGPGEIISGQTLIAKTTGGTVNEAVFVPSFGLSSTLGEAAKPGEERTSPGNRSKAAAMLRAKLIEAREYRDKRDNADDDKAPDRNLALEALVEVLDGDKPLIIAVDQHNDIMTALRLADEFDFRLILAGASDAHMLIEEISAAGVPVLIHPTMQRAFTGGAEENFSFTTAATLLNAGIPVALQGGFEGYVPKTRVVLFEAAMTRAYGATFEQALELVTMAPARILGIDDRVGSLEVGKDGDVALFDGDPFEFTSHVTGTIIEGRRVSDAVR